MAPWLTTVSWWQSTRVPTYWNDIIPPLPWLYAHLPKAPGSAQASRISSPGHRYCCWHCLLLSPGWRHQANSIVSIFGITSGLNWARPSILCLLGSAQQGGKWAGRNISPVTPQSNSSMKGMDFLPLPSSPMEEKVSIALYQTDAFLQKWAHGFCKLT